MIEVVKKNTIVALYSAPNSFEPFYLCYVIDIGVAQEKLVDTYNHVIEAGCAYLKCRYY